MVLMTVAGVLAAGLLFAQSTAVDTYQRAAALLERRDLEAARATVEEALRLDPKFFPALILKTRLAINSSQLDDAQRALEIAIAQKPSDRSAKFLLGMVLYLKNDFDRARAALESADPDDAKVVFYKAMTEEALNHTELAIGYYERAIKLDRSAEPRVAYARMLFTLGKLERAESLIDVTLRFANPGADALYEKGRCLFERGEFSHAAQFGERALIAPGAPVLERRIRYLLVRAYGKTGDRERAAPHQAAFDRLPNPLVR